MQEMWLLSRLFNEIKVCEANEADMVARAAAEYREVPRVYYEVAYDVVCFSCDGFVRSEAKSHCM